MFYHVKTMSIAVKDLIAKQASMSKLITVYSIVNPINFDHSIYL
jgi:hypothetical protein